MKTITLPVEKLALSVRQILLTLRHGETEDVLWWPIIGLLSEVESASCLERLCIRKRLQSDDMVFELISNYSFNDGETLVRYEHLWEEEYARMCDPSGEMLPDQNQLLISHLVWYFARQRKNFKSIKVIYCVYSLNALVHQYIVYHPIPSFAKIKKMIHEKLSLIQKYFDLPDDRLPPCTKEDHVFCLRCMVSKHCPQKGSL